MTHDTRACATSRLLGEWHSESVTVYRRQCSACGSALEYDGASAGVVNYSNQTLICEEIPRLYWHTFFTQKTKTIHSYWLEMKQRYEDVGEALDEHTEFVCRSLFT